ncbi:hypothetical protein HAX54_038111 [Datura stramonium]|uniref:Uncharacterized protein n=1 Tax=Datura stramonium TaxID=4076 RepID=A0ABS8VM55_DATST|nr:hypothetical protein [Datura stramonium]
MGDGMHIHTPVYHNTKWRTTWELQREETAEVVNDLCELTGYTKGKLPIRYLRASISAKRLTAIDCEMLVDKMDILCRPKMEGGLGIVESLKVRQFIIHLLLVTLLAFYGNTLAAPLVSNGKTSLLELILKISGASNLITPSIKLYYKPLRWWFVGKYGKLDVRKDIAIPGVL